MNEGAGSRIVNVVGSRAATPGDSEFCFQVHKAAMQEYIALVWGWDEEFQRDFHARAFDPDAWQIITADAADVGFLIVEHRPAEIYLSRLAISPEHQASGIGSLVVRGLLAEAAELGRPVTLHVLAVNPRARRLYERLGFTEVQPPDADEARIKMRAGAIRPAAALIR